MRIYQLDKRAFLFSPKPEDLLKGVSSNLLNEPRNALLTAQGKIIAVCDQKQLSDDDVLLVIDSFAAEACRELFKKFSLFTETNWKELDDSVYYDLDGDAGMEGAVAQIDQRVGKIIVGGDLQGTVSDEVFTEFRLDQQMPLHGIDYTDEMLLNVYPDDHVCYTKGCFVGQEVIARVHNLSKPPRQLVVKYEDECSTDEQEKMTSKVCETSSDRVKGFIFVNVK